MCQIVFYYLRYALKNKNLLRNQKLKSYQRIKSWPPTDEKAVPLQFNEKKRDNKSLIITCMYADSSAVNGGAAYHTVRNCFNLFQISFRANTTDTKPEVSRVSKGQKNCEKSKSTHCQVDHSPIIE